MSGTVTYLVDCSSFQGSPDWTKVSAVCGGGAEKVTEGTNYSNPRWADAKPAMLARAKHGFVPLAYLFMDAHETGASQADYFASHAGDLTGFGIVVDLERAPNGSPTIASAETCAAELRKRYPGHPIGGYAPHWYTGGAGLKFFDWLWASSYVTGHGDPAVLYRGVPASWWAPYGGRTPLLLQFTDAASVSGISGAVDCSAFHGTAAQLAGHVLPAARKPAPAPSPKPVAAAPFGEDDAMLIQLPPGGAPVSFPVWASASSYHERAAYENCSLVLTGDAGAAVKVTLYAYNDDAPQVITANLAPGEPFVIVPRHGWSAVPSAELQRLDTKPALGACAVFRTW